VTVMRASVSTSLPSMVMIASVVKALLLNYQKPRQL
jgi:hypothetical protein